MIAFGIETAQADALHTSTEADRGRRVMTPSSPKTVPFAPRPSTTRPSSPLTQSRSHR